MGETARMESTGRWGRRGLPGQMVRRVLLVWTVLWVLQVALVLPVLLAWTAREALRELMVQRGETGLRRRSDRRR
jgi:hypothetical protein